VKHDGFRILAWKRGERVLVWSRRADFTNRFQRIADAVRGLPADEAMIDGEAVVFQDDGRSDFHALLTKRGWLTASFVAFDLLRRPAPAPAGGAAGGARAAHLQAARRRNCVQ
jgi:bifunctional non-homologous end joining protein LigD